MTTLTLDTALATAATHQLGQNSLRALCHLAENTPITVGQIQQHLGVSKSAVTHIADKLHKLGLAIRSNGKQDRREVILTITPKGTEALKSITAAA
jgi:DNA-binding MarR family transcriptional regulator